MINAGYLTTNANAAWPLDGDFPEADRDVFPMFADGAAILDTSEADCSVVVRDIRVSAAGELSFTVAKVRDGGDVDSDSFHIQALDPVRVYATARGRWSFFVVDCKHVLDCVGKSFGAAVPLDPAAVTVTADKVTSISLYNHHLPGNPGIRTPELNLTHAGIAGAVKIVAGTNMYVGDDTAMAGTMAFPNPMASEPVKAVVIAAGAGLGAGKVPCEDDVPCEGGRGGNLIPDAEGNVVIEADDCYQISPDGVVRITGRCTACCQCDEYKKSGDRLAGQSQDLMGIYTRLMSDSTTYNLYAGKFNDSLCRVSREELLVKASVAAQKINAGAAHSVKMGNGIRGSIDRANGVVTVANTSSADVNVAITVNMYPQELVLANVTRPVKTDGIDMSSKTETVETNMGTIVVDIGIYDYDDRKPDYTANGMKLGEAIRVHDESNDRDIVWPELTIVTEELIDTWVGYDIRIIKVLTRTSMVYRADVPSGSSLVMRLYGARDGASPSGKSKIEGFVFFTWRECAGPDDSNDETVQKAFARSFMASQDMEVQ